MCMSLVRNEADAGGMPMGLSVAATPAPVRGA